MPTVKKDVSGCRKGGLSRSKAKRAASRRNGKLGGRPAKAKGYGPIGSVPRV